MITLKALSNIKHDGVDYPADYTVTVQDGEARSLIEAGVAVEASPRDLKVAEALRQSDLEEAKVVGPVNNAPSQDTAAKLSRPETSLGNPASATSTVGEQDKPGEENKTPAAPNEPSLEWSRKELEAEADKRKVANVAQFPNKQTLLDAILAAEQAPEVPEVPADGSE